MKSELEQKYTSASDRGDTFRPKWAEPLTNNEKNRIRRGSSSVTRSNTDSVAERVTPTESTTALVGGILGQCHPSRFWRFPFEMPFGKYKGQAVDAIREIDPGYLQWCLDHDGQEYEDSEGHSRTFKLGNDLRHAIEKGMIIEVRDEDMPLRCRWNAEDGCYEIV
jgi:hypothetical protein